MCFILAADNINPKNIIIEIATKIRDMKNIFSHEYLKAK